jgi:glutathione S-transferase
MRFPIYLSAAEETKAVLCKDILRWFDLTAARLKQGYLFGADISVADFIQAWRIRLRDQGATPTAARGNSVDANASAASAGGAAITPPSRRKST